MIVYLDTSALVKRYIAEVSSQEVAALITQAEQVGTSIISRAEVVAALAGAVRAGALRRDDGGRALTVFRGQWPVLVRLHATEALVAKADTLAWEHSLRGYDAVHLASATLWQEHIRESVVLATFDHQLWQAGQSTGLAVWPDNLA